MGLPIQSGLIAKYFHDLFAKYGFKIVDERCYENKMGFWVSVLLSESCRVRIMDERGGVMVAVGPLWDPPDWEAGPWFELPIIMAYLSEGAFTWRYSEVGAVEPQVERLSGILLARIDDVLKIFEPDAFPLHRTELERLRDLYRSGTDAGKQQ